MNEKLNLFIGNYHIKEFKDLLSVCIGKSIINQNILNQYIKDKEIALDINEGLLFIESDKYKISFIGDEKKDKTFIYADANYDYKDETILDIVKVLELGEKYKIKELEDPKQEIKEEKNGETISMISSILLNENGCYYKLEKDNRIIYFYVKDFNSEEFNKNLSVQKFASVVKKCITNYDLNQELLVESIASIYNLEVSREDNKINLIFFNNIKCEVIFDEHKRIIKLKFETSK